MSDYNINKTIVVLGGYAESLINFRGSLLQSMADRGCRVIACAPELTERVKQALRAMGVEYRELPFYRAGLNPFKDLKGIQALMALFREVKPDIVLSYTIKPVIYGSLLARLAGVKNIYSMITGLGYVFSGDSIKQRVLGFIASTLYKISLLLNRNVFFQNPDDCDFFFQNKLLKDNQKPVLINGSGIDLKYFAMASLPKKISFLLIARLLNDKGVYEYVEAARIVKSHYPEVSFRLVGWIDNDNPAGIKKDALRSWVDEGVIEYLGRLRDVRPAIEESSVYVLPSYREGTPRTVLEAMSMGRPIITTDAPGCRETVIDSENGFLIMPKNYRVLIDAMEKFINDPSLIQRLGDRSREIAESKYDVHKVNKVILKTLGLCGISS